MKGSRGWILGRCKDGILGFKMREKYEERLEFGLKAEVGMQWWFAEENRRRRLVIWGIV